MVVTVPKEIKLKEIKNINQSESEETSREQTMNEIKTKKTSEKTENDFNLTCEESLIPFTMRDIFFKDPFFQDTRTEIMSSRNDFFQEARKAFDESLKAMDKKVDVTNFTTKFEMPYSADFHEIKISDSSESLELSLV